MMAATGIGVRIAGQAYRALEESDFSQEFAWSRIVVHSLGEYAYLTVCLDDVKHIQKEAMALVRRIQSIPYPARTMKERCDQEALLGAIEQLEMAVWRAGLTSR